MKDSLSQSVDSKARLSKYIAQLKQTKHIKKKNEKIKQKKTQFIFSWRIGIVCICWYICQCIFVANWKYSTCMRSPKGKSWVFALCAWQFLFYYNSSFQKHVREWKRTLCDTQTFAAFLHKVLDTHRDFSVPKLCTAKWEHCIEHGNTLSLHNYDMFPPKLCCTCTSFLSVYVNEHTLCKSCTSTTAKKLMLHKAKIYIWQNMWVSFTSTICLSISFVLTFKHLCFSLCVTFVHHVQRLSSFIYASQNNKQKLNFLTEAYHNLLGVKAGFRTRFWMHDCANVQHQKNKP